MLQKLKPVRRILYSYVFVYNNLHGSPASDVEIKRLPVHAVFF